MEALVQLQELIAYADYFDDRLSLVAEMILNLQENTVLVPFLGFNF